VICVGKVSKALRRKPVINFLPNLVFRQTVPLLELALKLFTAAIDGS